MSKKIVFHPVTGEKMEVDKVESWMGIPTTPPPIFNPTVEGCFYRKGVWVVEKNVQDISILSVEVRSKRNVLIASTDWTVLPDSTLTIAQQTAWRAYRKALRDVTQQPQFPTTINWPIAPI